MKRSDKIIMLRAPFGKPQEFDGRRLESLVRETFASTNLYNHYSFSAVESLIARVINDLWEAVE